MLRILGLALLLPSAWACSAQPAVTYASDAAARLQTMLDEVHSVSFYFLTRTGEYSLDVEEFKKQSSIRIYRSCGNNCRNFMRDVIAHLREAATTECLPGQQNVLIEIGNIEPILYSYSGRLIVFQGKCYFNEKGIDSTVTRTQFLFD